MLIRLTKRQRVAALLSGLDPMAIVDGKSPYYTLEWHYSLTDTILKLLKAHTPTNGCCAIPYKTLAVKIITAHREETR